MGRGLRLWDHDGKSSVECFLDLSVRFQPASHGVKGNGMSLYIYIRDSLEHGALATGSRGSRSGQTERAGLAALPVLPLHGSKDAATFGLPLRPRRAVRAG